VQALEERQADADSVDEILVVVVAAVNVLTHNVDMRWLVAYVVGFIATLGLLLLFMDYGIGGCDCDLDEAGLFCWLCNHQLVVIFLAASPLWVTAILDLRATWRRSRNELLGKVHHDDRA
jgi:Flp pilus assembly protein protease CpaA